MTRAPSFGRKPATLTPEQRHARCAACCLYGGFVLATIAGLETSREGLGVLLLIVAFGCLFAGMAAASEC